MALFDKKPKKLSLDEILSGIEGLSEEEKAKVHAKMQDLYKAEDEREIDKIEEDKSDDNEDKDEKAEEVEEESEEIGKDVDEVEDEIAEDEGESKEDLDTDTEEVADEESATEDTPDTEEKIDEHIEADTEMKAWMKSVNQTLAEIKQALTGLARQPKQVEEKESDKLEALARKFE